MSDLYEQAVRVAQTMSVSTPKDGVVLYSVSFLPSKENKEKAFAYLDTHPEAMMIDQTECGKELIRLGLDGDKSGLSSEEIAAVWKIASARMISEARGDVVAFVKDADPRSVFRSTELPAILRNEDVKSINGWDKFRFAKEYFED